MLEAEGVTIKPEIMHQRVGYQVLGYRFSLPAVNNTGYRFDGHDYPVHANFSGGVRIAYVSCNGQENGDRQREPAERNVLWQRLAEQHYEEPLQLLLQGGDQLYADEMLTIHPLLQQWLQGEPVALREPLPDKVESQFRDHLFMRYLELYSQPEIARLMAQVPSLAMWDDHDICDGWGSLPEKQLDAPIGRTLFRVAREYFLLFQLGLTESCLSEGCLDDSGNSLSWQLSFPGFNVLALDLRSERRPDCVMGEYGWHIFRKALNQVEPGQLFVLSSVPALGPRLSWVEAVMLSLPHQQKYEDDLRDQWQSRAHRQEWREFLQDLLSMHENTDIHVSLLSGEIHLATHATMQSTNGPLQQFVASGIAHPAPPKLYARLLSILAQLGEAPLPGNPIRMHALPGQSRVYTAERNYLMLERSNNDWSAWWELEESGRTEAISI